MVGRVILQMAQAAPWNKKILRHMANAVRIQISVAIITYCLVAIVQHDMQLKRSTYEFLQILSISLTDKTHICDRSIRVNLMMSKNSIFPFLKNYLINFLTRPFLLDTNDK